MSAFLPLGDSPQAHWRAKGGGGRPPGAVKGQTAEENPRPVIVGRGPSPLAARISDRGGWGAQGGSLVPFAGELRFLLCR